MFGVLATLRFEVLNNMVQRARKNRSAEKPEDENELIHVAKEIYEEFMAVASYKCKIIFVIIWILMSKGKASQMLKRSTKLFVKRKQPKINPLHIENLKKDNEEDKEEDDMS